MEKNAIELLKSQYVKLIKETGEVLDGTIIQILDDSVIFQTELGRSAFSMDSIKDIVPYDKINKVRSERRNLKVDQY